MIRKKSIWDRAIKRTLPPTPPYKYIKRTPSLTPYKYNPNQALNSSLFQRLQLTKSLFKTGRSSVGSLSAIKNIPVFVDYAPTSKGKCFGCRVRIIKGAPRGWYYDKMTLKGGKIPKNSNWASGNVMTVKRLLCYKCIVVNLESIRNSYKNHVKSYTKNIKRIKRMAKMKKSGRALDTQKLMNAMESAPVRV